MKVLLIDDSGPIRLLCRVNLELEGYEVLEADDGPAGIEAARREQPDVVLLDLMLPTLDGWEVLDELQNDPSTAHVPVVLLTGVGSAELLREGLDLGAVAAVSKPFDPTTLAPLLRGTLARAAAGESAAQREESLARLEAEASGARSS